MAFPTVTTILDGFNRANESPLSAAAGWDQADYKGGTTNLLQVSGNQCFKNQPSTTGFGSQTWATTFGPDMECLMRMPTKATDGQELLVLMLRLQTIGTSTTKGYALVTNAAAGTDGWEIHRITTSNFGKINIGSLTQEVSAGDYIGADVIDSGGNPVIRGFYCPSANDPTLAASWTQVVSHTDTDATFKVTGTGKLGLEMQGIVSRFDDFRGGTVASASTFTKTGLAVVGP